MYLTVLTVPKKVIESILDDGYVDFNTVKTHQNGKRTYYWGKAVRILEMQDESAEAYFLADRLWENFQS